MWIVPGMATKTVLVDFQAKHRERMFHCFVFTKLGCFES